jgi:ABC-type lipoprotein export system ATPase subunit
MIKNTTINKLLDNKRRDFRITSIGFVFQDFELLDYLNVLDNIVLPYRITKALSLDASVKKRAAELAEEMGIDDKLKRMVNDLS